MAWQADPEQLRQLAGFLRDSLNGRDPTAQKKATSMLSQAKSSPDITNYLTYILCRLPSDVGLSGEDAVLARSAAALTLKNLCKTRYATLSADQKSYLQNSILSCVGDPNLQIRNLVGNILAELVVVGGVMSWPELYSELVSIAGNSTGTTSSQAQEGAMSALGKICEDNKKALDRPYQGQRPLDMLMPRLYALTSSPITKVQILALQSINVFIPLKAHSILTTVDALLSRLFQLAHDNSESVRRTVCHSFVLLVDLAPDALIPHMQGLVTYLIAQQQQASEDPELALEAAEFWLAAGEHRKVCQSLEPYLTQIVPVLLASMVYSPDDIARLEGERDDAEQEDREQDIKPQFASSRRGNTSTTTPEKPNGIASQQSSSPAINDDLSDGEIEESSEEGDEDPEDEWNLRKCSAATLDHLATQFPNKIFEISLPSLRDNLRHANWPNREAAVLAFGAIADGCEDVVAPYLPELIPFLINLLQDPEPVVRKITSWALGRYTRWVITLPQEQMAPVLETIVDNILKKMLDRNKSVQEGAASAFSSIEETAKARLTPYLVPIVQQLVKCFDLYKDRNMYILYDCVQTLAEHVGPALSQSEVQNILMPALVQRWHKVSDESRELFPLLECLSYVATAMDEAFLPYAAPIFSRCVQLVHRNLNQQMLADKNPTLDQPDKDYLVTSLDLLSAIIQALPPEKSGELVDAAEPRLFDLLKYCFVDRDQGVRQSAYAILGDLAINLFSRVQPLLPELLPLLLEQIDVNSMPDEEAEAAFAVINNACWACGEIATQDRKQLLPHFDLIYERLFTIVGNVDVPPSVVENAAIALGRLGVLFSEQLAPRLSEFAKPVLISLGPVEGTNEKGQALLGLNRVVLLNPSALGDCLVEYLTMAVDMSESKCRVDHVLDSFHEVLRGYKSVLPNFDAFVSHLPPAKQQVLYSSYKLQ